jgi:hypothetical protein
VPAKPSRISAFRRSELVALDVADLRKPTTATRVTIRRSKTDQEGHGATIAIAWLAASGILYLFFREPTAAKVVRELWFTPRPALAALH